MKILRLALVGAALASFAMAARAQSTQPPAQDQSGYQGCSSRSKPAVTS